MVSYGIYISLEAFLDRSTWNSVNASSSKRLKFDLASHATCKINPNGKNVTNYSSLVEQYIHRRSTQILRLILEDAGFKDSTNLTPPFWKEGLLG